MLWFTLTPDYIASVVDLAHERGLKVHLDGARIFNAVVALGVDVKEFTRHVDSLSFCMSKGLSAPVGSLVCGTHDFIAEARRNRKLLGGGMRQAGIIAAPGIVALDKMVTRLAEDHENAGQLAQGITHIPGLSIDVSKVKTNIVYFDITNEKISAQQLQADLEKRGVKALATGPRRFRMVTHYGVSAEDISMTLKALEQIMNQAG